MDNVLPLSDAAAFRRWLEANHDSQRECWLELLRGRPSNDGFYYLDAVEVALCFGWIDSTQKRIDDGKPLQRYSPRRKGGNWCEHNLERCRRLVKLGEMTPAGLAVTPDLNPARFVFEDWVLDALKADKAAWKFYRTTPANYRRIMVDRIQHYHHTARPDYALQALQRLVDACREGKLLPGWSDFGRLENY